MRLDRLQMYVDWGVAEVWVYDGESLVIQQWQNGMYITSQRSQFLTGIPIPEMAGFLQQAGREDYLTLVKAFRGWVRGQIGK